MPKLIAKLIFGLIKLIFRDKTDLVLENLALRHQLSVLKRKKKPKLKSLDRAIPKVGGLHHLYKRVA